MTIGIDAAVNNIAVWDMDRMEGFITDTRKGTHADRCFLNVDRVVEWIGVSTNDIAMEFTSVRARASIPMIAHMGLAVGLLGGHLNLMHSITLCSPAMWMRYWKNRAINSKITIKRDVVAFLKCYPKKDEKKKQVQRIFLSSLPKKERDAIIKACERYPNALRNNLVDAAGVAYWHHQTKGV